MIYTIEDCEQQAIEASNGGFKIPGKFYPDVSKWEDDSITEFFKVSYPKNAPTKGYIQKLSDLNKMQQDENAHDWIGNYERKLKQDKFNAEHPSKPLPKKAPPKINKRSWLTKRTPEVEYSSLNAHVADTVGDTSTYSWDSSSPSVASVINQNSNTTTVTGVSEGKANINAHLKTVDDSGNTATSSGSTTITVTAAPAEKAHAKTGAVSLSNTAATVGTAFSSNVSLSNLVDADDGSYVYYWSFSGTYSGLSFNNTASATPVISGTPTAAGTASVRCSVKDSYGNYATITAGTITITSTTLNTVTVSVSPSTGTHGVYGTWTATATCDAPDDGTYVYKWDFNSNPNGLSGSASGNKYTMTGTPTAATTMQPHAAVTGHNTTKSGYGTLTIN